MHSEYSKMENVVAETAWYCARTKPKHEHIAAANLLQNLQLQVFNPRLKMERATKRGLVRTIEPLFPCYIFVHCSCQDWNDIRYVSGVSTLVHFGQIIPTIPDQVIGDLRQFFDAEEPFVVEERLLPGAEITVAEGAFQGFQATVLRVLPARQRIQILLDILGRPTVVEIDRSTISIDHRNIADLMPSLAVIR